MEGFTIIIDPGINEFDSLVTIRLFSEIKKDKKVLKEWSQPEQPRKSKINPSQLLKSSLCEYTRGISLDS